MRYRTKVKCIVVSLVIIIGVTVVLLGNSPIINFERKVEAQDNVGRLTDNLAEKLRLVNSTQETVIRAQKTYEDAQALHDQAIEEYNTAIESINLYQTGL